MKRKLFSILALLLMAVTGAQADTEARGGTTTISSDRTDDYIYLYDGTLIINQGVTFTCNNAYFKIGGDFSTVELHGTLTGNVSSSNWTSGVINVYLSDGAKYTVTGQNPPNESDLRYYGYDAATDGNGTVSVKNGTTDVTSESTGSYTTTYTFTATPASGYKFKNWTKGAGGEVLGTDASINVTCEQNGTYQVYANFEQAAAPAPSGPEVAWNKATKTGTFKMPAGNVELQVEYEPTKVTMAVNDKTMGTAEVAGESKVEWTADTWKGWTSDTKEYTVDDITMTSSESAHIREYTSEDEYNNSLFFFVRSMVDDATVTFSTTGDPFSRIEFTMIGDYSERNPNIIPNDNWTFEGKSAVWEGEATKSLTLQSCSTNVSKITFFKGAIPDGVTINGDGTFTVAKTATVTLTATPAEGYKFLYWEDDQTNTNPVRKVTIESGMADMTYKAVFAEILYNVTFAEGTNPDPENPEWTASPATDVKKGQTVTVTYTGSKKVIGVKAEKKAAAKTLSEATLEDIGKIAGADGNIYDTKAAAEAVATGNAVAMIAYVGSASDCTHGLAIALADESGTKTWSEAGAACSGKTAVTGGTWRLPSIKDWQYMFIGCGASGSYSDSPSTMSYSELATKLTTANGTALQTVSYWSSTESSPGEDAWSLYFGGSSASFFSGDYEGDAYPIRACLAF